MLTEEVVTYLRWLRYVVDVTLCDKTYVIINVDETSVSALLQKRHGYVGQGIRLQMRRHQRRPIQRDRSDVKTTLMGVICDQPELQPYLPQVFMPKYTQNAIPPAWMREVYGDKGFHFNIGTGLAEHQHHRHLDSGPMLCGQQCTPSIPMLTSCCSWIATPAISMFGPFCIWVV